MASASVIKVMKRVLGNALIFLVVIISGCNEDDFKAFNTDPTIKPTDPKIRFLNLNNAIQPLTIKVGGKIIEESMTHRSITAYELMSQSLLGDSVIEVLNVEGKVLTKDTLHLKSGFNYTVSVIPAYTRVISKWMVGVPERDRWMFKVRTDSAVIAVINDPAIPPLADRSSARLVAFAIDQAQANYAGVVELKQFPLANRRLNLTENPTGSNPFLMPLIGFPPSPGYNRLNPPITQTSPYLTFDPRNIGVSSRPIMDYEGGMASQITTLPYGFQGGKSYTVITNGTYGIVNDTSFPTSEKKPYPLEPIPYEMYILDDADGTARTLVPEKQYYLTALTANHTLLHLNPAYKETDLTFTLNGTPEDPAFKCNYAYGLPNPPLISTGETGENAMAVVAAGSVRPVLAQTTYNYKPGGYYVNCFYEGKKGEPKLKVIEQDTLFKPNTLSVKVLHFSPDLGKIRIVNETTGATIQASIDFEGTSTAFELPIETTDSPYEGYPLTKKTDRILVYREETDELLFTIDPTPNNFFTGGTSLLFDPNSYSRSTMPIYYIILHGRYNAVDFADRLNKKLWAAARNTITTTGDRRDEVLFSYKPIN